MMRRRNRQRRRLRKASASKVQWVWVNLREFDRYRQSNDKNTKKGQRVNPPTYSPPAQARASKVQ